MCRPLRHLCGRWVCQQGWCVGQTLVRAPVCCGNMIGLVDCVSVGGASARLCFCRGAMIGPVDSVSTIEMEVGMSARAVCRPVFVFCFGDMIGLFDCVSAGDVSARLCFVAAT